jgi:hypothetical protein
MIGPVMLSTWFVALLSELSKHCVWNAGGVPWHEGSTCEKYQEVGRQAQGGTDANKSGTIASAALPKHLISNRFELLLLDARTVG